MSFRQLFKVLSTHLRRRLRKKQTKTFESKSIKKPIHLTTSLLILGVELEYPTQEAHLPECCAKKAPHAELQTSISPNKKVRYHQISLLKVKQCHSYIIPFRPKNKTKKKTDLHQVIVFTSRTRPAPQETKNPIPPITSLCWISGWPTLWLHDL